MPADLIHTNVEALRLVLFELWSNLGDTAFGRTGQACFGAATVASTICLPIANSPTYSAPCRHGAERHRQARDIGQVSTPERPHDGGSP
jgi:hypothetical protein